MRTYWPILLVIASNTCYHVCAKSIPSNLNPMASLTVTYLVSAIAALLLCFLLNPGMNLLNEYRQLNWAPVLFGLTLVGLEVGSIYMYKLGWNVSVGALIANIGLAVALLLVGRLVYKEPVTLKQLAGIGLCVGGMILVNA